MLQDPGSPAELAAGDERVDLAGVLLGPGQAGGVAAGEGVAQRFVAVRAGVGELAQVVEGERDVLDGVAPDGLVEVERAQPAAVELDVLVVQVGVDDAPPEGSA